MQRLWRTKIGATSLNQLVTPALLLILTVLAPSPVQNDDAAVILLLQRTAKQREQPERIHTAWVFPPRQTNKPPSRGSRSRQNPRHNARFPLKHFHDNIATKAAQDAEKHTQTFGPFVFRVQLNRFVRCVRRWG